MLATYLSSMMSRVSGRTCSSTQPWEPPPASHRHIDDYGALQLPDVLLQVLSVLDSNTLCTAVPLVCKQWRLSAADPHLWKAHLPPQLLALALRHPTAQTTRNNSSKCNTTCGAQSCSLVLLHHATFDRNLLRNPSFLQSVNSDYMRLMRIRPITWTNSLAKHDAGGIGSTSQSVVSTEQRRLAWVSANKEPESISWQNPPADINPSHATPPQPLPYPRYNSSSSSLPQQLHGWLKGITATAVTAVAATAGAADGEGAAAAQHQQQQQAGISCLATGSNWSEVVQVVDLLEELILRGLDPQLAAAVLDSGALALGLSVWAAAPDYSSSNTNSNTNGSSTTDVTNCTPGGKIICSANQAAGQNCQSNTAATDGGELNPKPSSSSSRVCTHRQEQQQRHNVDGAGCAALRVALLLDDGQVPLRSFQTFVRRDSSHHFVSRKMAVSPAGGWNRYTYLLPSCPRGCRRAVVLLRGRGPLQHQHHSGSSSSSTGVKFASAELVFVKQQQIQSWQDGSIKLE